VQALLQVANTSPQIVRVTELPCLEFKLPVLFEGLRFNLHYSVPVCSVVCFALLHAWTLSFSGPQMVSTVSAIVSSCI